MTQRYVIHLPIVAADLPAAQRLARLVGRWSLVLPQTEPGGTTVSVEDDQNVRHWVFCDALLPNGRRCLLHADHDGPCARRLRRWNAPEQPSRLWADERREGRPRS